MAVTLKTSEGYAEQIVKIEQEKTTQAQIERARSLMRERHEATRARILGHIKLASGSDIVALETLLARLDGFIS